MNYFLPLYQKNNPVQKFYFRKNGVAKLSRLLTIMICVLAVPGFLAAQTTVKQDESFTEKIILAPFSKIKAGTNIRIVLVQSATDSGYIASRQSIKKNIRYGVSNGELYIAGKSSLLSDKIGTVVIGIRDLKKIVADENASINTNGILRLTSLEVLMKGDGTASINADADNIITNIRGKGKVTITGNYETSSSYLDGFGGMVIEYTKKEAVSIAKHQ
jgi:Putative auto-transporter adhesin, head GIN domain